MKTESTPPVAAVDQPRLVRHVVDGGKIRRFTADGPNEARDNCHEVRMENGQFIVTGFASAFLSGDACMIEAMKHPEEWEIVPNDLAHTQKGRERGPDNTQD